MPVCRCVKADETERDSLEYCVHVHVCVFDYRITAAQLTNQTANCLHVPLHLPFSLSLAGSLPFSNSSRHIWDCPTILIPKLSTISDITQKQLPEYEKVGKTVLKDKYNKVYGAKKSLKVVVSQSAFTPDSFGTVESH